jgi:hypothetical protein
MKARDVSNAQSFANDDRAVLVAASDWAAWGLNDGLASAEPYVFEPAQLFPGAQTVPGGLRVGVLCNRARGTSQKAHRVSFYPNDPNVQNSYTVLGSNTPNTNATL